MKVYTLRETDNFVSDLQRTGEHLGRTTGEPATTDETLLGFRAPVDSLTGFPNRFVDRRGLGDGIRLDVVRQKGIVLFHVDDHTQVVPVLRASYGGEDYGELFHGERRLT